MRAIAVSGPVSSNVVFWHLSRHLITLIVSDQMDTTNLSHELTIYWTKHLFFHYSSPWGIILFHLLDDIVQYDYIALVVIISNNSVYFSWYLPRLKKNISFIIIPFPLTKEGRKKQQVRRERTKMMFDCSELNTKESEWIIFQQQLHHNWCTLNK